MNHSCEPSVFVDTSRKQLIALKDLKSGDEVTFFYPSTEWCLAEPFECSCGTPACIGRVAGAQDLSPIVLSRYQLSAHITQLLALK